MQQNNFKGNIIPYNGNVLDASGNKIPILGIMKINLTTPVGHLLISALVFKKGNAGHDILLGMNMLKFCEINMRLRKLVINEKTLPKCLDSGVNVLNLSVSDLTIYGVGLDRPRMNTEILQATPTVFPAKGASEEPAITGALTAHRPTDASNDLLTQELLLSDQRAANSQPSQLGCDPLSKAARQDGKHTSSPTTTGTAVTSLPRASDVTPCSSATPQQTFAVKVTPVPEATAGTHVMADQLTPTPTCGKNVALPRRMTSPSAKRIYLTRSLKINSNTCCRIKIPVSKHVDRTCSILLLQNNVENILVPNQLTEVNNNRILLELINISDSPIVLEPGTILCTYVRHMPTSNKYANAVHSNNIENPSNSVNVNDLENARSLTEEDLNCGEPNFKGPLLNILNKNRQATWLSGEKLGVFKGEKLKIKLKNDVVVNKRPYTVPYAYHERLDKAIHDMESEGIISKSNSNFNSPLIVVKKGDGSIRPCLDLRELNKVVEDMHYPLPKISDLLNSLGQAKYFSTLDLAQAFHQCEVHPNDRDKVAFTWKTTKYSYNRVPYGLKVSPLFFARVIKHDPL